MQKIIVLEDGDTYGGFENSRVVKVYDEAALEDIEDYSDLPDDLSTAEECSTLGEIEQLTRRTLRAWYAMDKRTEQRRINGDPETIEMDAAVYDLALALGITPYEEHPDTITQELPNGVTITRRAEPGRFEIGTDR